MLYLLLLEPLLRSLACKARGDARHAVPPLVQAYCDDLLLIAHSLPQFLEYAAAIARYLTDMGMSLNMGKCAYVNTARIQSIMVYLNPGDTAAPWLCLRAKGTVPYLGLRLDPRGMATMKEKHVLRCEALLGWCKNTLGPASVPHEVMAAVVGGIVRYAAPYLSDTAEAVMKAEYCHQGCVPAGREAAQGPVQRGGAVRSWATVGGCPGYMPRLRRGDHGSAHPPQVDDSPG